MYRHTHNRVIVLMISRKAMVSETIGGRKNFLMLGFVSQSMFGLWIITTLNTKPSWFFCFNCLGRKSIPGSF